MTFSARLGRSLPVVILLSLTTGTNAYQETDVTGFLQTTIAVDQLQAPLKAAEEQGTPVPRTVVEINILNSSDTAALLTAPGSETTLPVAGAANVNEDSTAGRGWLEDRFYLRFAVVAEFVLLCVVIGMVVSITGSSRETAESKKTVNKERFYLVGNSKTGYFWKPFKVDDTGRL